MKSWHRQRLIWFLAFSGLLVCWGVAWGQEEDYSHLCQELKASGLEIVDSGVAYGVPFVQINLPRN